MSTITPFDTRFELLRALDRLTPSDPGELEATIEVLDALLARIHFGFGATDARRFGAPVAQAIGALRTLHTLILTPVEDQ